MVVLVVVMVAVVMVVGVVVHERRLWGVSSC